MPTFLPPKAERTARRYILPFLALVHLSGYHLFRAGIAPPVYEKEWLLVAIAATGGMLLREALPARRKDRFPDVRSIVAWGAASVLELHAQLPLLAESRIVPAVLFPVVAYLLDLPTALVYGLISFAWLSWVPGIDTFLHRLPVSMLAMAILGTAAGVSIQRMADTGRSSGEGGHSPIRSIPILGRTEDLDVRASEDSSEREALLETHERKAFEAIGRVVEGILPASGADLVTFIARSDGPGRPFQTGPTVRKGGGSPAGGVEVPDSYLPLQEAVLFRRPFFQEGPGAWNVRLPGISEGLPSGVAAAPIWNEGVMEGALLGFRFGAGTWEEPVIPLLETGAFLIGREITESRIRYRTERTLAALAGYHRFFHRVAELAEQRTGNDSGELGAPRQEIYRVTVEETSALLRADRVLLIEADERGIRGRIVREEKRPGMLIPSAVTLPGPWVRLEGTYAEWVLEKGIHRIFTGGVRESGGHPVLPAAWEEEGEEDSLLVPVAGTGGFRGVLACLSAGGRSYHARDVEAVREVLRIMRMGISHAATLELLEQRATTDGLTGLLNRKTFQARLSAVLARLDGRYPCALIMLDIDHFKRVNDTYGHPTGDEVLRAVSGIIRKTIRKIDMAGRFGGEEFVIYLHHADRNRAANIAERLRMIIEKARVNFRGTEIGVTASLGVSCYPQHGGTVRDLVARADEALYRSKQGGRNRIHFA